MGLLSPWLLLLGLAAAVPFALHLMHRRPGPRVDFPAVRYLRRAQKERGQRVRLRQLALLALRIVAVLLIALAAARPFLPAGEATHAPTAVALVIDNSLSTGAITGERRVLDELLEVAGATLDAAGPDDRFWLIQAGTPWLPAQTGDATAMRDALADVRVASGHADIPAAVARAAALLRAGAGPRAPETHVLTDLQRSGFHSDSAGPASAEEVRTVVWTGTGLPQNRGVTGVQVAGGLAPRAGEPAPLTARLGGAGTDSVTLRLWLDGLPIGAAVGVTGSAVAFTLPAQAPGWVSGYVEAAPDALPGDDRRAFAFRARDAVLVQAADVSPFVRQALETLAAGERIRWVERGRPDVLASGGGAGLDAAASAAVVVLPPSDPLELQAANTRLAAAGIPVRFDLRTAAGAARVETPADAELAAVLSGARVSIAHDVTLTGAGVASDTLLRLSDGRPLVLRVRLPNPPRIVLVATTPLTAETSSIAASAGMVPLVDRLVRAWSEEDAGAAGTSVWPGTVVEMPGTASALEGPDGARRAVEGGAPVRLAGATGLYRALDGDSVLAMWAVAPSAQETDPQRASEETLARGLAGADLTTAATPEAWRSMIFRERRGGEWWRLLALLLIAALLVESVTAARSPRPDA